MPRDLDRSAWSDVFTFPENRPVDLEACRQAGERKRELLKVIEELDRHLISASGRAASTPHGCVVMPSNSC